MTADIQVEETDASTGPLTFDDESWSTTYEVEASAMSMMLRDLAAVGNWAVIEFHPMAIVGRVVGDSHVTMGRTTVSESHIESSGAFCRVGVNVGAVEEFAPAYLAIDDTVDIEIDREERAMVIKDGFEFEEVDLSPDTTVTVTGWPECEHGTTARMKGWEFASAVEGACGATNLGFEVESDLNDIHVSSVDTPWETTVEGVVEKTAFDASRFGELFWPEITDRLLAEDDVEMRLGSEVPLEIEIGDRVEYVVCPRITDGSEDNGGESA